MKHHTFIVSALGALDGPSEGFAQGAGIVGFDQSSLVQYAAYSGLGREEWAILPRVASNQYAATSNHRVSPSNLRKGDLLFWGYPRDIQHVAIYIGDGRMIEARGTGTTVHVAPVRLGPGFFAATRLHRPAR